MSNFSRSALGGLLFACWLMCFVFPISLVMSFSDHTPIGTFLGQQVVNFFFLWFICGAIAHGINGMFDDLNKPRPRDPNDHTGNDQNRHGNDQPSDSDHNADQKTDQADNGPKQ
jgi:hypothetical protein